MAEIVHRSKRRLVRSAFQLPPGTALGFGTALLAVLSIGVLSYHLNEVRRDSVERAQRAFRVLEQTDAVLVTIQDAETGQRGYLLTGVEDYLDPYVNAVDDLRGELERLRHLLADSPAQQGRLVHLEASAHEKMSELAQTIELRRDGNAQAALALLRTGRGKQAMDRIRGLIAQLKGDEQEVVEQRTKAWDKAVADGSLVIWAGSALLLFLIPAAAYITSRDFRVRETASWLEAGQAKVSESLQGGLRLAELGERVLATLADYLEAQVGTVFIADGDGFRCVASYALPPESSPRGQLIRPGDGLIGQVLKERRVLHVRDVPADYLMAGSSLGAREPLHLLIAPASVGGRAYAALELGLFHKPDPGDLQLLTRASESIAVAVRTALDREQLEELLEETQRQAEELQTQQEELRVTNEELEEQSRALGDSQARLEGQRADLEESNTRLEEQTQLLERQKEELLRIQAELGRRAAELARANQYKSEFLANMSHELRTPLNSSLIMAQLLAENKQGNLSEEQVRFAKVISSAGNDLLALINDILDLSKIEAGKMELHLEPVDLVRLVDELGAAFRPLAQQKGVAFETILHAEGLPAAIETDPQRLQQILNNLLSNAVKFTEQGAVTLRVFAVDADSVGFAIRDTGIGISAAQQQLIFEAFRQADGTTHRKYGGTGLGLSISRDLATLLGGDIQVASASSERGSEFTLRLPRVYRGASGAERSPTPPVAPRSRELAVPEPGQLAKSVQRPPAGADKTAGPPPGDDREHLIAGERVILVIEDDADFARIVADLAHELGFQCLIAYTADSGIELAQTYLPSAVVLDMVLPDHSGLSVLDRLKRQAATRHIPVHVVSAADNAQLALAMGAVGYVLKPVQRDQLLGAFQKLEAKLAQKLHRVLIVEDDPAQRDSIAQLLAGDDVDITAVASAADVFPQLAQSTFDCMVLDLPDSSTFELLERMSREEVYSFPPVIVYTHRSLTPEEEQRLRRYSRSIVIKGAKSPERLMDEVTLFLHQVESQLSPDRQRMLRQSRDREAAFEERRILVVEDDVRNIFALTSVLEPKGAKVQVARNGREALERLGRASADGTPFHLVLMDIMMPEMDGLTAMQEIRKRPEWKKLPIIALTAKAMPDDHERCLAAGASDYIAKPLDVDKLLSLARVWMSK